MKVTHKAQPQRAKHSTKVKKATKTTTVAPTIAKRQIATIPTQQPHFAATAFKAAPLKIDNASLHTTKTKKAPTTHHMPLETTKVGLKNKKAELQQMFSAPFQSATASISTLHGFRNKTKHSFNNTPTDVLNQLFNTHQQEPQQAFKKKKNIHDATIDNAAFFGQKRNFRATKASFSERKRDHYDVLGVQRGASDAEIKKAYFMLAKKFHPDSSSEPDAAKRFQEISAAYEVLSVPEKRQAYDQFGHDAEDIANGMGGHPGGPGGMGFSPEDLIRDMFFGGGMGGMGGGFGGFDFDMAGGGQQRDNRPRKGGDIQVDVKISFMESVNGADKQINVPTQVPCKPCGATGTKPGAKIETCRKCQGTGSQRLMKGMFQLETVCQPCGGKGTITPPCGTCHGETTVTSNEKVTVKIPAGVDQATSLRVANNGDAGYKNGPRGHLWVKLNITPDPRFRRDGADIHVTAPLPLPIAVLGGVIPVTTLSGETRIRIPPGTQPKDTQILRNSGMKIVNRDQRGHLYIHFDLQIPRNPSEKAKNLMREFTQEVGLDEKRFTLGTDTKH